MGLKPEEGAEDDAVDVGVAAGGDGAGVHDWPTQNNVLKELSTPVTCATKLRIG